MARGQNASTGRAARSEAGDRLLAQAQEFPYKERVKNWRSELMESQNSDQAKYEARYDDSQGNRYEAAGSSERLEKSLSISGFAGNLASTVLEYIEDSQNKVDKLEKIVPPDTIVAKMKESIETDFNQDSPKYQELKESVASAYRSSVGSDADSDEIKSIIENEVKPIVEFLSTRLSDRAYGGTPDGIYAGMKGAVDAKWDESFENDYNEAIIRLATSMVVKNFKEATA